MKTLMILQKQHKRTWSKLDASFDHPCWILIIGRTGSGKRNSLFNLIVHQSDIDKSYSYAKDPYEGKYKLVINRRESTGSKNLNDYKAFIEYSNDMDDVN